MVQQLQHQKTWLEEDLVKATFLEFSSTNIARLISGQPDLLKLNLPLQGGEPISLLLYKAEIFTPAFTAYAASNPSLPLD